jgi:hypothetical protein
MFAAIYFGQEVFAGLLFIPVIPPPPPPPPVPVFDYSCRFGIGLVIGTSNAQAPLPRVGLAGCRDSLRPVLAVKSCASGLRTIGTKGGPSSGSCP